MEKRFVYADNSATTPVADYVLEAMMPYFKEGYGNPSSIYTKGREAKAAIELAREQAAKALNATSKEIFFTSCGTESDNWAIKGAAAAGAKKGKKHLITTNFEHHAVLHTFEALERQGFETTFLPVNREGLITPEQVRDAIRPDTALVSIIYANNEIGTIQPIAEIGRVCREAGVLFHTDAVQAVGNVPIDVQAQCIDMLSLSGHKINTPKGVGALYLRKGVAIEAFMEGGAQESKKRAGTENVPYIVGLGVALERVTTNIEARMAHKRALRDRLIAGIREKITRCQLNGSADQRLVSNVNFSFEGVEGEALLLLLDMQGICGSSGSACTSGSLDPSHVLMAIGLPHEIAHGSLRLSFGDQNTEQDVDYILEKLPPILDRLRAMSPVWETIMKNQEN